MQVEVECKANELVAAPQLLDYLDLNGCVVTGDAIFTQRDLCIQIVEAGGQFILPVKGNQKTLQETIADAFMPAEVAKGHHVVLLEEQNIQSTNSEHGRIECRYLSVTSELKGYLDFPHVQQVFRLQRVIHHQQTGKLSYQVVFGICSLSAEHCLPEQLMAHIRSHWHIENRLHYVRDVTFHEDACRIRHRKRQRLLATLNNLVIGLIRRCEQFEFIPEARRYFDANYDQAFQLLL
jgi:predicted transposase YbfD/YdcC